MKEAEPSGHELAATPTAPAKSTATAAHAEIAVKHSKSLSDNEERLYCVALSVGVVALGFGLYFKFLSAGNPEFSRALLATSVTAFALTLGLLGYRLLAPDKAQASPVANAGRNVPEQKSIPKGDLKISPKSTPEIKTIPVVPAKAEALAKTLIEPRLTTPADVDSLMKTTLGDLLMASYLKDPDSAGRIIAQAIVEAGSLSSTNPANHPSPPLVPDQSKGQRLAMPGPVPAHDATS